MTNTFLINQAQVAMLLDTTTRSVRTWQDAVDDPLPIHTRGKRGTQNQYNAHVVLMWWHRREIAHLIDDGDGEPLILDRERARLAAAQASRQELALAREKRELIPASLVTRTWQALVAASRARILAIPTKSAPRVIGLASMPQVEAVLKEEIYAALNELEHTGFPDDLKLDDNGGNEQ